MDRSVLAKATSNDDSPTPGYMYGDIAAMTHANFEGSRQLAVYLLDRMKKPSHNIKFKCLQIIKVTSAGLDLSVGMQAFVVTALGMEANCNDFYLPRRLSFTSLATRRSRKGIDRNRNRDYDLCAVTSCGVQNSENPPHALTTAQEAGTTNHAASCPLVL